ncbi:MAG: LysM peptidoglycan-binding domain-containing protein [Clostridiales bacterium]|nr:LysM peptidoglycan-binding domain-containing protein [Eubacteriales bacterium]MDH7565054.1 LysM peptidoglycan-binding domain-containing protein [Clostridiales bacterium]
MLLMGVTAHAATYTVVSGDTLYKIGKLFGTSSSVIMETNGLSSDRIYPGQKLSVPSQDYTVKSGDTLYLIAKKYNITLASLRKVNNKWDDYLSVGQKLIIPAAVSSSPSTSLGTISYSTADVDLLARLVTAEAAGEPYDAKVGVAAVVINRVKDPQFPNTISSVIYQKSGGFYQFTPVQNGWINKPASEDARKAALEALNGRDPSNGALYYFDDSATNRWLWSKPITARIGRMVFVY